MTQKEEVWRVGPLWCWVRIVKSNSCVVPPSPRETLKVVVISSLFSCFSLTEFRPLRSLRFMIHHPDVESVRQFGIAVRHISAHFLYLTSKLCDFKQHYFSERLHLVHVTLRGSGEGTGVGERSGIWNCGR